MKAFDDAGIDYQQVKDPTFPRSKRTEAKRLTGQDRLPYVEFEDGTALREETKDLVARIKAGNLGTTAAPAAAAGDSATETP